MRRYLLALACLLLWAQPASAQFTLVGQDYQSCTLSASCTFATGVATNAGDLLVAWVMNREDVAVTFTDATNGAWTCPAGLSTTEGGSSHRMEGCYFINSGAATIVPTADHTANARVEMIMAVFRPTGTVTADTSAEGTNVSGTSHVTPSISASANAQLVTCGYAFSAGGGAETAGTGYTLLTNGDLRMAAEYDITSVASGSFTCNLTTTNSVASAGSGITFNDSGGGGAVTPRGMLLGVLP